MSTTENNNIITLPPRIKPEIDTISERKQGLVNDFYNQVWLPSSKEISHWPTSWKILDEPSQRIWCYKLMVARKFNIEEAKKMMMTIIDFRRDWKTEDVPYFPPALRLRGYNMEHLIAFFAEQNGKPRPQTAEVDRVSKYMSAAYNPCFHKFDKWGHPVLIETYGRVNPTLLIARGKQIAPIGEKFTDVVARYHVHQNEMAVRLTRFQNEVWAKNARESLVVEQDPKSSKKDQKKNGNDNNDESSEKKEKLNEDGTKPCAGVQGITVVIDTHGLTMGHLGSDCISAIGVMFEMDAKVYPEFITKVLVINVGGLIRFAYGLVKPFLDVRVQEKITFYGPGEATEKALQDWIPIENIPALYGGKCNCEGGCLHIPSEEEQKKAIEELGKEATNAELAECGVPVGAGAKITREYEAKKGDDVVWEWQSDSGYTVEFSAEFIPSVSETATSVKIIAPEKMTENKKVYVAEQDGKVKLTFSNEFSWMRSKYLTLRCFVVPKETADSVQVEGGESEKDCDHKK